MIRNACFCLAVILFCSPTAFGQRNLKDIPDPDPEIERKALEVAEGYEIHLFAADPALAKPIQMNFDAAGRLWVACSEVYPQIKPGRKANDKIIILEDTDNDGKADKTTVFADGLLIPTGIEPGDGGAYVANSTELLHLSRSPGNNGKADRSRVVLSGFGTEDTHHILHTLRWGPEGLLYFNQSIYIHSHIETPHGVRRLNGGGVWWFRPETMELEVFTRGLINPWGHHFDAYGRSFQTDGAGGEGINLTIPGAYYVSAVGASRVLTGLNPGSPKYCGLEVVSGRHLPPDIQGDLITNDFRGHRVCRFKLKEDGSGVAAIKQADLVKSNFVAFRPIDVKMGPDGAIYIADWYNPIIQHGEVDFRDPRRDQVHGRIWRVTAKGRPLVPKPQLVNASVKDLLAALNAPEDFTRHHAKRVLKERGAKAVLPELSAWVGSLLQKKPADERLLLEALWVYQSLDTVNAELLNRVVSSGDYRVRQAGLRVLMFWGDRVANRYDLLTRGVRDEHPTVRLEAVRGLALCSEPQAIDHVMSVLEKPMDRFLDYAVWLTIRETSEHWLPDLRADKLAFAQDIRKLLFALKAIGTKEVIGPLAKLLKENKVPAALESEVLQLLTNVGGPNEIAIAFERIAGAPEQRLEVLDALEKAARERNVRPNIPPERVAMLLNSPNDTVRSATARLIGLWKLTSLRDDLLAICRADAALPIEVRKAALEALAAFGQPTDKKLLLELNSPKTDPQIRALALGALASLDLNAALPPSVAFLTESVPAPAVTALLEAILRQKGGEAQLTKVLADRNLPPDTAKVALRVVRASGRANQALLDAVTKAGNLKQPKRVLTAAELSDLVGKVRETGNAERGESIFRRPELNCIKCHAIAGAGGQVGPSMESLGASAQIDYLIESMLQPNKAIKENYHSLSVVTDDDKIITGIKLRETKTELVLRSAEDKEIVIPTKKIVEKSNAPSLMPEGLVDDLTSEEFIDLVRFLSELGKEGPYAIGKARVVRTWLTPAGDASTKEAVHLLRSEAIVGNDKRVTWVPVTTKVNGELPLSDLVWFRLSFGKELDPRKYARVGLNVTVGGKVLLKLNSTTALEAWLDGKPLTMTGTTQTLDLTPGNHTLVFAMNPNLRKEGLRLEIDDVPNSPARVEIVR